MDLPSALSVVVHTENDKIKTRREYEVIGIKGQKEGLVQRLFLELPIRSDLQLMHSSWQQCLTLILVPQCGNA
jgi:hypothetical protein